MSRLTWEKLFDWIGKKIDFKSLLIGIICGIILSSIIYGHFPNRYISHTGGTILLSRRINMLHN